MSKFIHLIDAGHGGIIDGVYQTSGKRSPKWDNGLQYFEGDGNRDIRLQLAKMLTKDGIDFHYVSTGEQDIDLDDRVDIVRAMCRAYGTDNCILWSIHSNGFSKESANGWEVWTTKGTTKSDPVATILFEEFQKLFPESNFRSDKKDGDVDKEANFYIIANVPCRAVLSENFFHTNYEECNDILLKPEGRKAIAQGHYNAIKRVEAEIKP